MIAHTLTDTAEPGGKWLFYSRREFQRLIKTPMGLKETLIVCDVQVSKGLLFN